MFIEESKKFPTVEVGTEEDRREITTLQINIDSVDLALMKESMPLLTLP